MSDLGRQLELQRQINKALVERQKLLEQNAQGLTKQASLAKEVCKALKCQELDGMERRLGQINNQLSQVSNNAEKGARGMQNMTEHAQEAESAFEKVHKKGLLIAGGIGALRGAVGVFSNLIGLIKGGIRLAGTFAKGIWGITKALINVPMAIWGGLMDLAQRGGGAPVLAQALEEVRKEFGNLAKNEGKALKNSLKGLRSEFDKSAVKAHSFRRIFGHGHKGLAEALKFTTELATAMGTAFTNFAEEMSGKNVAHLAIYRKGLGLTAEQQAILIKQAHHAGKDWKDTFSEMSHYAELLGEKYEISSTRMGKMMGELATDVSRFGNKTNREYAITTAHAHRLGIEIKTLQAVMDKFDNWEDAAETAAHLRREFGMMIDHNKMLMMSEIERTEHLKESFHATGKTWEDMHRLQKNYMADKLELDRHEADALFSKANKNKKLTDTESEADKVQKQRIRTNRLLQKLSANMAKQFETGNRKFKGFLDAFMQGFQRGIVRQRDFWRMLRNIRKSLHIVYWSGRRVGKMFVQYFPGVLKMVKAMKDFFDPKRFRVAMHEIEGHFKGFFLTVEREPEKALLKLGTNVRDTLLRIFGVNMRDQFVKGFDTFVTLFGKLGLIILKKGAQHAAMFINGFTNFLIDVIQGGPIAQKIERAFGLVGAGARKRFGKEFSKLWLTIKDYLWPAIKRLGPVLLEAIVTLYQKIGKYMTDHSQQIYDALTYVLCNAAKFAFGFLEHLWEKLWTGDKAALIVSVWLFRGVLAKALIGVFKYAFVTVLFPWLAQFLPAKLAAAMFGPKIMAQVGANAAAAAPAAAASQTRPQGMSDRQWADQQWQQLQRRPAAGPTSRMQRFRQSKMAGRWRAGGAGGAAMGGIGTAISVGYALKGAMADHETPEERQAAIGGAAGAVAGAALGAIGGPMGMMLGSMAGQMIGSAVGPSVARMFEDLGTTHARRENLRLAKERENFKELDKLRKERRESQSLEHRMSMAKLKIHWDDRKANFNKKIDGIFGQGSEFRRTVMAGGKFTEEGLKTFKSKILATGVASDDVKERLKRLKPNVPISEFEALAAALKNDVGPAIDRIAEKFNLIAPEQKKIVTNLRGLAKATMPGTGGEQTFMGAAGALMAGSAMGGLAVPTGRAATGQASMTNLEKAYGYKGGGFAGTMNAITAALPFIGADLPETGQYAPHGGQGGRSGSGFMYGAFNPLTTGGELTNILTQPVTGAGYGTRETFAPQFFTGGRTRGIRGDVGATGRGGTSATLKAASAKAGGMATFADEWMMQRLQEELGGAGSAEQQSKVLMAFAGSKEPIAPGAKKGMKGLLANPQTRPLLEGVLKSSSETASEFAALTAREAIAAAVKAGKIRTETIQGEAGETWQRYNQTDLEKVLSENKAKVLGAYTKELFKGLEGGIAGISGKAEVLLAETQQEIWAEIEKHGPLAKFMGSKEFSTQSMGLLTSLFPDGSSMGHFMTLISTEVEAKRARGEDATMQGVLQKALNDIQTTGGPDVTTAVGLFMSQMIESSGAAGVEALTRYAQTTSATTAQKAAVALTPEQKKVAELQAASESIESLRNLAGVPRQLRKLKKKMDAAGSPEEIKAKVAALFETVKIVGDAINAAVTTHFTDKKVLTLSDAFTNQMAAINTVRSTLDTLLKRTPDKGKIDTRISNLKNMIDKAVELHQKAAGTMFEGELNTTPYEKLREFGEILHGPAGIVTSIPSNIEKKVKSMVAAVTNVGKMIEDINTKKEMKIAVNLAGSLSKKGATVTFHHKDLTVTNNVGVTVFLDTKKIGTELIKRKGYDNTAEKRFLTTSDQAQ